MIEFPRIASLPDESRLWLYAANRPLTGGEGAEVMEALNSFFSDWSSHGRAVKGAADLSESRIVAIAAHIPSGDISGCGIDKSVHLMDDLAGRLGFEWVPSLMIAYRDREGNIVLSERPAFRQSVRDGLVGADTLVIDLSPATVGSLRAGSIECRAADAWHGRVFGIKAAAMAG